MAQQNGDAGPLRYFSGENEDGREYKRWKTWVKNKLLTLDKLPESSRGAFVYTLLNGKALEAVEHLEPEEYQKKDGDALLWRMLDARFPQKEVVDELGEILGEVFHLHSKEGETMKQWTARAQELFDRCARKTGVQFPDEARGWILLNRSGLSDEQRAVAIARAHGDLKKDSIGAALRSCYPDLVLTRQKKGVALVEHEMFAVEEETPADDELPVEFQDVDDLLRDHQVASDAEGFPEADVAEVLAVSWKEKRQELNKLSKTRQFQKAKDVRRSFRVEVEELKRQTNCNKCGKRGHWARECRSQSNNSKGGGKGSSSSSSPPVTSGAGLVAHQEDDGGSDEPETLDFVAAVFPNSIGGSRLSPLDYLRQMASQSGTDQMEEQDKSKMDEVLLVSCPGFGVLDSGCGRTIIGAQTLAAFEAMLKERGHAKPVKRVHELHCFKYGNGETEKSVESVLLPAFLAGRSGQIKAAVVKGDAPLLISRSALKTLKATIDFDTDSLTLFGDRKLPLQVNGAGQYMVNLLQPDHGESSEKGDEKMVSFTEPHTSTSKTGADEILECSVSSESDADESGLSPEINQARARVECVWTQEDVSCLRTPLLSRLGPKWKTVFRRIVRDARTKRVLDDKAIQPGMPQHLTRSVFRQAPVDVLTEFHWHAEDPEEVSMVDEWLPTPHQLRQMQAHLKTVESCHAIQASDSNCLVMEVFSPPRFSTVAKQHGFEGFSYDLKNGYDLSTAAARKQVEEDLDHFRPHLLVLCPPCTDEGGWFELNSMYMDSLEYLRRTQQSRRHIRWCCKLFKIQAARGGHAMFEHPTGARTWTYAEMQSLCRRYETVKLHMCRYGLRLPQSSKLIRKSTRLLVTHPEMKVLSRLCPGGSDPKHVEHDTIAGGAKGVSSISQFCSQYTSEFVLAVLETIPVFRNHEVLHVQEDMMSESSWQEILAVSQLSEKTDAELRPILLKLHKNLGHPPNHDLVRILKHGQANEQALRLAKELQCDFCKSQQKPGSALPAQPNRVVEFNHQIGMDVKHLTGWKPNQKIKSLNVVDTASSFQRVIPFFETETSTVLRRLLQDHWIAWAGPPKEIVLDPAQTNLGELMVNPTENQGTHVRPIAAGAHWQLGKTESHGGWFNRTLEKIIEEHQPKNQEEWLECVAHAHIKNQMIQVHGYSPQQFVFGKNISIPSDLMNEPLQVVPATASLQETALARSQAMRTTARMALIQMQDDRACRVALLARPRKPVNFQPGDLVAYWRDQKWTNGQLNQGGRWYGTAVVLGAVGRNLVIVHRRQVLRVAPEQIRMATEEEKTLISSPKAELLGIKDLIEKGNLRSKQYIDLLPQSYPPGSETTPPSAQREGVAESSRIEPVVAVPEPSLPPVQSEPPPLNGEDRIVQNAEEVPRPSQEVDAGTDEIPLDEMPQASSSASSSYGPIRRRIVGKDGSPALWRPPAMKEEDFVAVMKEMIPSLVDQAMSSESEVPKRSFEEVSPSQSDPIEPSTTRVRTSEVLSVQECQEVWQVGQKQTHECMMAEYLRKKMQKEIPHSNNPPMLQKKVDEGKRTEWETLLSKPNAIKIHYGRAAQQIRAKHADRFIGSRFVLTRKPLEEGAEIDPNDWNSFTVKGRWCLQGHLDPDLQAKAEEGLLKSPTLSQLGRMTLMQVISSHRWELQLGDIKGAFLEAKPLDARFKPLFAHQPAGGIPGLPKEAVIEVLGNVYGQNDAPAAWFKEFNTFSQSIGWTQSKLDPCLYTLRQDNKLVGIMGVHVDDTALGGQGEVFQQAVRKLRERFPYRKWRHKEGEFCGAWYRQDESHAIEMKMSAFAEKIRPINVKKGSRPEDHLCPSQMKILRAVNGSLNWLSSQSRPDLAVQTSLSQQAFPHPKILDFRMANQAVRRARLEKDLGIQFKPINPNDLRVVCHSDAAFANVGCHTQAGFVIGFTEAKLQSGFEATWTPAAWRSFRLNRAVSSTLGAESQSMSLATGTVEWLLLLLSEILDGPLDIRSCRDMLKVRQPILVTDCKSLYDHLLSPSSPTSIEDRRTSIDVVIIRESCKLMAAFVRWVPTDRMLADALTKDSGDATDLLRACMKRAAYQISPEETVLEYQAMEKERRLQRKKENA